MTRRLRTIAWLMVFLGLASLPGAASAASESFKLADRNEDGVIDQEEYRLRMVETFYLYDADRNALLVIAEIPGTSAEDFAAADKNGDGGLDMGEFLVIRFHGFHAADGNGDGVLSPKEVEAMDHTR